MDLAQWIPTILFAATVFGWAMKYGADQQKLKSKNEMQDAEITNIKEAFKDEKDHNARQHQEFYDYGKETIGIKSDIKHMMGSIDQIKIMLERRSSNRDQGGN